MQHIAELPELIGKAANVVGSEYKLAQALKVSRQTISDWKHARKTCAPADVALIASVAGLDASAWLVRATLEKYEGTPKGDALYKALGKALLATGAAVASSGAHAMATFGQTLPDTLSGWLFAYSTMYRNVQFWLKKRQRANGPFFSSV